MTRLGTVRHAALAVAVLLCAAFTLVLAAPAHHPDAPAAWLTGSRAVAVAPGANGPASGRCCADDERPHEAPRHTGVRVPALLPDLRLPRGHACFAVWPGLPRVRPAVVPRGHDEHLHALSRTVSGDVAALLQVFRC